MTYSIVARASACTMWTALLGGGGGGWGLYINGSSTWKVQSIKVKSSINFQTGKSWYHRNLNWKPWCNWKGMYCYLNAICVPKCKHYHTFMETNYAIFRREHYNFKPGNYLINRIFCKYIIEYHLWTISDFVETFKQWISWYKIWCDTPLVKMAEIFPFFCRKRW